MKKNNKKGFTLVELVIVVAVMAILVAVAIPTVGSVTGSAKKSVYQSNCRTLESVIKLAEAEANKNGDHTVGTFTLTNATCVKAVNDAKLGIENDVFYFHTATGAVNNISTELTNDTVWVICFTNGTASASAVEGESAQSPSYNGDM